MQSQSYPSHGDRDHPESQDALGLKIILCADGTIITWTDAEAQAEIALSFQEAAGCGRIWRVLAKSASVKMCQC